MLLDRVNTPLSFPLFTIRQKYRVACTRDVRVVCILHPRITIRDYAFLTHVLRRAAL